uniref:Carbonic anhydrase n=1 Tax=Chelonoidis abingdonii TaxID=106734 RepID=A0A8C0IZC7_CHEAB
LRFAPWASWLPLFHHAGLLCFLLCWVSLLLSSPIPCKPQSSPHSHKGPSHHYPEPCLSSPQAPSSLRPLTSPSRECCSLCWWARSLPAPSSSLAGPPPPTGSPMCLSLPCTDKDEWQLEVPFCGGQMQSPINIDTNSTNFSRELQPVVLAGYNLDPSEQLSLMNNGHTVVLRLPGSLTIASGYPQEYRAMQLHLHWGSPEGPGSEHTVDGRRYDGEIHMVYYNPSCGSIKEAMKQPGGLAVLAAFLQVMPMGQPLGRWGGGSETTVAGFNIEGLLPANLGRYYRYSGSLTTPPCYQTVNWTVFNQTVLLSKEQILLLETTLQGDDDTDLQNNFRLTQPLHGRKVLASFQASLSPRQVPLPGKELWDGAGRFSAACHPDTNMPGRAEPGRWCSRNE